VRRLRSIALFALSVIPLCLPATQRNMSIVDAAGQPQNLGDVLDRTLSARVVYIGEIHDRYDHHLNQLEILQALWNRIPQRWAIGMEIFQRSAQPYLDAYISGAIEERELLEKASYFERWGYDYRLYRPVLEFARAHGIALIALNAEQGLVDQVSDKGLDGLPESIRVRLPAEIDKSDTAYRQRMRDLFLEHGDVSQNFEHFWETQLVWDETMAEVVANYLARNADKGVVVLTGSGHLEYGSGIPNRVHRRVESATGIVLLSGDDAERKAADFVLLSPKQDLPPAGKLGVAMDLSSGVRVKNLQAGGAAERAGMKVQDQFLEIDGRPIGSLTDFRLALLDGLPGQTVEVRAQRSGTGAPEQLRFQLVLQ